MGCSSADVFDEVCHIGAVNESSHMDEPVSPMLQSSNGPAGALPEEGMQRFIALAKMAAMSGQPQGSSAAGSPPAARRKAEVIDIDDEDDNISDGDDHIVDDDDDDDDEVYEVPEEEVYQMTQPTTRRVNAPEMRSDRMLRDDSSNRPVLEPDRMLRDDHSSNRPILDGEDDFDDHSVRLPAEVRTRRDQVEIIRSALSECTALSAAVNTSSHQ